MRSIVCILFAFLCIPILCGCQRNPADDVVINKLESDVYLTQTNTNSKGYVAPSSWSEKIENGSVTYQIQADVIVPTVAAYPIIEVTPKYFDYDSLDQIITKILPSAKIKVEDISIATKQDVQKEIDMIIASINNVDKNHPNLSKEEKEAYLKDRQIDLEAAQEMYKQAPEEIASIEIKSIKEMQNQTPYVRTAAVYDQKEQKQFVFKLRDSHDDLRFATFSMQMMEAYDPETKTFIEYNDVFSPGVILDDVRIRKVANSFISQIELDGIYYLNSISRGIGAGGNVIASYTKDYAGIPTTYAFSNNRPAEVENHIVWPTETILIYIDAGYHVRRIDWIYPSEIVGVVNENASLLPFEKIQQLIKTNLAFCQPDFPYWDNVTHRTIVIDRIDLAMMRVSRIKAPDIYTMIPVWDCFGYYIDHYESQDKSEYILNENNDAVIDEYDGIGSFLTINAIDGSVIDRNLGY